MNLILSKLRMTVKFGFLFLITPSISCIAAAGNKPIIFTKDKLLETHVVIHKSLYGIKHTKIVTLSAECELTWIHSGHSGDACCQLRN